MKILSARPTGMAYKEYRNHLRQQKNYLRNFRRGRLVWASSGVENPEYNVANSFSARKYLIEPMGTYRRGMQLL